jgi:hypothetical protein
MACKKSLRLAKNGTFLAQTRPTNQLQKNKISKKQQFFILKC